MRGAHLFQLPTLLYSRGHRVATVGVESQRNVIGQPLATLLEDSHVLHWVAVLPVVSPVHPHLEGPVSLFVAFLNLFEHLFGFFLPTVASAPIQGNLGPSSAAKKSVHRHSCRLAHNVPAGDVDGPDDLRREARCAFTGSQGKRLPNLPRLERANAHEKGGYHFLQIGSEHAQASRSL